MNKEENEIFKFKTGKLFMRESVLLLPQCDGPAKVSVRSYCFVIISILISV